MNTSRRNAFTLIEMIVITTIMLFLAALGTAFLPKFLDNQYQTRGVDQLSQWLLIAKQRAKRDGFPTGLRFVADPTTGLATTGIYVQQPDQYTAGFCTGVNHDHGPTTFSAGGVDFQGAGESTLQELWLVQPSDYLEVNGGGSVYLITDVTTNTLNLANTQFVLPDGVYPYRIIRQPRRLLGESDLTLPQDIAVDLSASRSLNVPQRQVAGGVYVNEILFSPSGAVIGQGTPSGKIILWVRNATKDPMDAGASTLIAVQIRTGFIAAHPISLNGDPYLFTEDGKSSGM